MTQSSTTTSGDNAPVEKRAQGGAPPPLLASLPSAAHKKCFLAAVEAVLLGQSGICLTGGSANDRAAFIDQLAAMIPANQVVVARLGRAASPDDLKATLEAAGGECARLAHVLLAVLDADELRRDTLDQLNTIAGDLNARRQGLQLLLTGYPRLLDRLRVIPHENLLRYLQTRLKLPALTADAPGVDAFGPGPSTTRPPQPHGVPTAARPPRLPQARKWRPNWVAGASVVAASALLAAGGLTLTIWRTAPERGAAVAVPHRFAAMDTLQPAIVPYATMSDAPAPAADPATQSGLPQPAQPPSALAATSPEPAPVPAALAAAPGSADALAPAPAAPDPMPATVAPIALTHAPALASTPVAPAPLAPAPLALASAPPAPDQSPALDSAAPSPGPALQQAFEFDMHAEPSRPAGPGLLLVAERGDTLAGLYRRIYAGVPAPPFAAVLAVNRGPVQPGARLLFPAPPGGWPTRPFGAGLPQGPARAP